MRRAAKRDLSEPLIVEALEKAGWKVYRELPTDLLCWKAGKGFRVLECKTPRGKAGKPSTDKRRVKQIEFIELTGIQRVTSAEAALAALGEIA